MQEERNDRCGGCGKSIEPTTDARRQRSWCDLCSWIAPEFYAIERAGRLLTRYGLGDVPIAAAVGAIREQLQTGQGPAREIALSARREAAEEAEARARFEFLRRVGSDLEELTRDDPMSRDWVSSFMDAIAPVAEEAADWDDSVLVARYRAYVAAELEWLAANCVCGHQVPHLAGTGCRRRRCGCGSPARARRAAEEAARARTWSDDDLRRAWPALGS
jgi:hypothetical protein